MKEYAIKKVECSYNTALCDYMLEKMSQEGFSLERIEPFGKFVFEYNSDSKKQVYFSYINLKSQPGGRTMRRIYDELCMVYQPRECVRKGTKMCVYTFEASSKKEKSYLNTIAARHGLTEYTPDTYISALRRERDAAVRNNYGVLTAVFGLLAVFFGIVSIIKSLWLIVMFCPALYAAVSNLVKYIKCK